MPYDLPAALLEQFTPDDTVDMNAYVGNCRCLCWAHIKIARQAPDRGLLDTQRHGATKAAQNYRPEMTRPGSVRNVNGCFILTAA